MFKKYYLGPNISTSKLCHFLFSLISQLCYTKYKFSRILSMKNKSQITPPLGKQKTWKGPPPTLMFPFIWFIPWKAISECIVTWNHLNNYLAKFDLQKITHITKVFLFHVCHNIIMDYCLKHIFIINLILWLTISLQIRSSYFLYFYIFTN